MLSKKKKFISQSIIVLKESSENKYIMCKIISESSFFRALCWDGSGYCGLIEIGKGKSSFICFEVSAGINSRDEGT